MGVHVNIITNRCIAWREIVLCYLTYFCIYKHRHTDRIQVSVDHHLCTIGCYDSEPTTATCNMINHVIRSVTLIMIHSLDQNDSFIISLEGLCTDALPARLLAEHSGKCVYVSLTFGRRCLHRDGLVHLDLAPSDISD